MPAPTMRVKNPNAASAILSADKTAIQAALVTLAGSSAPTFDEIRAVLSAPIAARCTDGYLSQAAAELGLAVQSS
jgi:hypothetical protein